MNVVALGIDLVVVAEIQRLADLPGGHFLARCFTAGELADAGQGANRADRLAGRFAAKEAVLKALGTGQGNGIAWTDVEIRTSETGAPKVVLHNMAAQAAEGLGITAWLVSTSHAGGYAVANVIALNAALGGRNLPPCP